MTKITKMMAAVFFASAFLVSMPSPSQAATCGRHPACRIPCSLQHFRLIREPRLGDFEHFTGSRRACSVFALSSLYFLI